MRKLLSVFAFLSLSAAAATFPPGIRTEIDRTIETAIAEHKVPGGVFHLERAKQIYEKAYGNRALVPATEKMTVDTIFDAASITKGAATTPAIWLLIQRGSIAIDDPVQKYVLEFPYSDVTIRHLLTHTSGLRPDLDLKEPWSGYDTAMQLIMKEQLTNKPGYIFRYSDINFELLGEIVQRVSGQPLDVFVKKEIYQPLGMNDSGFRVEVSPRPAQRGEGPRSGGEGRVAPTEMSDGVMLRGVVHDPTARRMGGVAGHAGLFTTVHDLAKYCRMLLRGGSPVFKPEIVNMMTTSQSPANVAVKRAGGFDLDSGFSRPRGDFFPVGSFGHTGWTGGMFWIDPASKTFYIFLSNRVHPDGKGNVLPLQRDLGNLAGKAAGYTTPVTPRVRVMTGGAGDAMNGIDVVVSKKYEQLRGMRIGLITNHTGIDKSGNPTIDLLRSAPGLTLVSLFSPEHGIRGVADENVGDTLDTASGLPIYSLYGETRKPTPEQLANIDALVFDIQDVGTRFYTYISTLGLAMEAAAATHKKFIVLDRVNPIGGVAFEGPLRKGPDEFIAWHTIPVRHGMTVGELARMFNAERNINADLTVIELKNWKREQFQDEAGIPWINTSPNMRSLTQATLYPGIGLIEYAISVGRGTPTPFEIFGAPYIDGERLLKELPPIAGVSFAPVKFTPNASHFAGKVCGGLRVTLTDRKALKPVAMGVAIATAIYRLYPNDFPLPQVQKLLLDPTTLEAIRTDKPVSWEDDEAVFAARRAAFLIYK